MQVLITGGAGFLGRALVAYYTERGIPTTVYSRDETKQDEARRRFPQTRFILGDVNDTDRLALAMAGHDIVIHAAALKYVPEAELNVAECVRVNVDGARSVITAAIRAGVERVVGISTDKAVEPINVYGLSKALMERLFAEAGQQRSGGVAFTLVRYGNVVGSTGSVIPLFQRQYKERGVVSVTNPRMTRFWMSVHEAIACIEFALADNRVPGSITVPRMKGMSLGFLAAAIAGDAIEIIGERPGEKEHEKLIHWQESVRVIRHRDFYELIPVGSPAPAGHEPFMVSSSAPDRGMMGAAEMLTLIEEARHV